MSLPQVYGNLLVAQKVHFNYEQKSHSIENIYNNIYVEVMPSIAIVDVWAKLIFSGKETIETWIEVLNPANEIILNTEKIRMDNVREKHMQPGIDFSLSIRFLVASEGNYSVKLYSEYNEIFTYIIFVSCIEN